MNTTSNQEPLQDYWMSYMNENTTSNQEPLQDYWKSYMNDFQDYYILQIFSIPHIIQKIFYCLIFNIYQFVTKF